MLKAIVCVDKKWAIGKNNDLLFSIKGDMAFFKQKTLGQIVFCGRKTLLSFPGEKPLKNRSTICLCSEKYTRNDCFCVHNFEQAVKLVLELAKTQDVFVIGGGMLYEAMLPFYDEVYVTKVDADGGGDICFPCLDKLPYFKLTDESETQTEGAVNFKFCTYKRERHD